MEYEELLTEADLNGIYVIEDLEFESQASGLINGDVIGLNKRLSTYSEKTCVLSEELGHYHTSVGNILDQTSEGNRKQEYKARLWAYNKMITIEKLISAKEAGCRNRYEIAEHLNVTEPFLQDAIDCYRSKYGLGFQKGEYIIFFEPFNICRMAE
ncbi:ImmA/IrrE family metallo-endopeptidase [Lacrimispora sp.]|uniref:ImmA/IrrE family metallo-endopeptidase n=1 Tax=Lacrimispora sp. TaxID=2719234 RepID=UPI003992E378